MAAGPVLTWQDCWCGSCHVNTLLTWRSGGLIADVTFRWEVYVLEHWYANQGCIFPLSFIFLFLSARRLDGGTVPVPSSPSDLCPALPLSTSRFPLPHLKHNGATKRWVVWVWAWAFRALSIVTTNLHTTIIRRLMFDYQWSSILCLLQPLIFSPKTMLKNLTHHVLSHVFSSSANTNSNPNLCVHLPLLSSFSPPFLPHFSAVIEPSPIVTPRRLPPSVANNQALEYSPHILTQISNQFHDQSIRH